MQKFSFLLYRFSSGKLFFLLLIIFVAYVTVIMPAASDVPRIVGGGEGVLGLLSYSVEEFYSQVRVMTQAEKDLFIDYRLVNDMGWILVMACFFRLE